MSRNGQQLTCSHSTGIYGAGLYAMKTLIFTTKFRIPGTPIGPSASKKPLYDQEANLSTGICLVAKCWIRRWSEIRPFLLRRRNLPLSSRSKVGRKQKPSILVLQKLLTSTLDFANDWIQLHVRSTDISIQKILQNMLKLQEFVLC